MEEVKLGRATWYDFQRIGTSRFRTKLLCGNFSLPFCISLVNPTLYWFVRDRRAVSEERIPKNASRKSSFVFARSSSSVSVHNHRHFLSHYKHSLQFPTTISTLVTTVIYLLVCGIKGASRKHELQTSDLILPLVFQPNTLSHSPTQSIVSST